MKKSIKKSVSALFLCAILSGTSYASNVTEAEQIVAFDSLVDGIPEAIATDYRGNIYASLGHSVQKLSPTGEFIARYDLPTDGGNGNGDMVVNWNGDIFVNNSGDEAYEKGVWKIQQDGTVSKFADIDPATSGFLNGIAIDCDDNLYVADSQANKIYKIDSQGNVEDWLEDPSLAGDGSVIGFFSVGVNNLVLDRSQRFIYASNLDMGTVLKIRIKRDGTAGKIRVFAEDPLLKGIDGLTFDRRGKLYAAVNIENRIVKINPKGKVKVIEDPETNPETLLDFPSDVVFGKGKNTFTMFITNFSLFSSNPNPGILKIERRKNRQ